MRKAIGGGMGILGAVTYFLVGLVSLVVNLWVIMEATNGGFIVVVIGIFFFPATLAAAPWYAVLAWGNFFPLAVTYGGFILTTVLVGLGGHISGEA